jgi:hypothetical protein
LNDVAKGIENLEDYIMRVVTSESPPPPAEDRANETWIRLHVVAGELSRLPSSYALAKEMGAMVEKFLSDQKDAFHSRARRPLPARKRASR